MIKLEKEYTIPIDIFVDGYRAYQKKFVYPKSYYYMAIFAVLCANFVYGIVNAPSDGKGVFLAYIFVVLCLAMIFREWYNPRKTRRAVTETVEQMGAPLYRLTVTDKSIEIATVQEVTVVDENAENADISSDDEDDGYEEEAPAKPTVLPFSDELSILEYDRFFLIVQGKQMFYIVPKDGFSEEDNKILREIKET